MEKSYISKIHCRNFKAFADREIEDLGSGINIFIGDNDTGKSTVLLALDLVMRASVSRIQTLGLERLMHRDAISAFMKKEMRTFSDLPELEIDLYLSGVDKIEYYGEYNVKHAVGYGISLICRPRPDYKEIINEIIKGDNAFPFEYYSIEFKTFSGSPYVPYKKLLQHIDIDNTKISSDTASRGYIRDMYKANAEDGEQSKHQIGYRQAKAKFTNVELAELNKRLETEVAFALRSDSKSNLETDLTIKHNDIDIDNIGMGMQCFIRTSFALSKKTNIDVVLLEEPENHLSQANMKKLIDKIASFTKSQIFVATHSSYICSRLDLRKAIMFGLPSEQPLRLNNIPQDTAEYFMKAPQNSLLEFAISARTILVEGDAEYGLVPLLFGKVTGKTLEDCRVSVIAVGGIRFRRYLDVAKVLGHKVAVITDNDGAIGSPRLASYKSYEDVKKVQIFFDSDEARRTFEICVYQDNKALCDHLFLGSRKTLSVQDYMLAEKSEAAFRLAEQSPDQLATPEYLKKAMTWISA